MRSDFSLNTSRCSNEVGEHPLLFFLFFMEKTSKREAKTIDRSLDDGGYTAAVCVCVCVFIKLHITTQSGPVILVILCHSH